MEKEFVDCCCVEYRTENRLWTAENRDWYVKKVEWRIENRMWNI